jgi:hypothetical protein
MSSYVFIDSRVQDSASLLAGLASDAIVIFLDPLQDGLAQIALAVKGVSGLDAIHIISHGSAGALYLGDTVLTSENLDQYARSFAIEFDVNSNEAGKRYLHVDGDQHQRCANTRQPDCRSERD